MVIRTLVLVTPASLWCLAASPYFFLLIGAGSSVFAQVAYIANQTVKLVRIDVSRPRHFQDDSVNDSVSDGISVLEHHQPFSFLKNPFHFYAYVRPYTWNLPELSGIMRYFNSL